ncbi:hypothetical protein HO173_012229 [Letharia columbiana]|uniref:Uncharacterized protein n=1 Tax=Letharia columbiana TaxID=112416 RepID=A0A8H6CPW9_9LECA|nr:uncharacterized protein HO173_012229 [Letharia columbiana]KAF6227489.1 hypothetical protein HO173_012229 [Letharia columbiana]
MQLVSSVRTEVLRCFLGWIARAAARLESGWVISVRRAGPNEEDEELPALPRMGAKGIDCGVIDDRQQYTSFPSPSRMFSFPPKSSIMDERT